MTLIMRHPIIRLLALVCCATSMNSWAVELRGTLDHVSEYTTNSELTSEDKTEEWVHSPGFTLGASESTVSLDLEGDYRYQRRIYTDSDFENEDVVKGAANATWRAVPNRLDFFAGNRRRESTRRASQPDNPDNRQIVSETTVGSNLRFQPRSGDELVFGYAYAVNTRDSSNNDFQSHTGTASYRVGLSQTRNLLLLGRYADAEYDSEGDATTTTVTLGYSEIRDDLLIDASAGYKRFERNDRDTIDGGVYEASITWNRTPVSTFSIAASRGISDQSRRFLDTDDIDEILDENTDTNEAFIETRGRATWTQELGANQFSLSAFAGKQEYEDVNDDNEQIGVRATFSRALTRSTRVTAQASYQNRQFDDTDDEQDEVRARLRIEHQIGRRIGFSWGGTYRDRETNNTEEFDEWTFFVGATYAFLGVR